jgi:hypothetical protein
LIGKAIMNNKTVPLGAQEHAILRAIARTASAGSPVELSSTQRLRFEMLGLIEDRADGVRLTERGRKAAAAPAETSATQAKRELPNSPPLDRRGRRLGLRRRSPF